MFPHRKDKYNKKLLKYKVEVEDGSSDYEHDEEKEVTEEANEVT